MRDALINAAIRVLLWALFPTHRERLCCSRGL